jgi:hypothetical protein
MTTIGAMFAQSMVMDSGLVAFALRASADAPE